VTKDEKIAKLERKVAELTNTILSLEDLIADARDSARETDNKLARVLAGAKNAHELGIVGTERMALR
jgi:uncharacterized coiled-coil protein SlyX